MPSMTSCLQAWLYFCMQAKQFVFSAKNTQSSVSQDSDGVRRVQVVRAKVVF